MSVCPIPAEGQSQEPRSVWARLTGNIWLPLSYHSMKIKPRVFPPSLSLSPLPNVPFT